MFRLVFNVREAEAAIVQDFFAHLSTLSCNPGAMSIEKWLAGKANLPAMHLYAPM
jgi:hypothetical protein